MIQAFAHKRDGRFLAAARHGQADPFFEELDPATFLPENEDYLLTWIDIEDPTAEELAWLGSRFHFHPLALEDCAHFDQRPKLEEYAGHLFLVVHGLRRVASGKLLEPYELHCFVTESAVVTVHQGRIEALDYYGKAVARERQLLPFQVDFALHKLLDVAMDGNPRALDTLDERIEEIDDEILQKTSASQVERIHELQREIAEARRLILPQRDVYLRLALGSLPFLNERSATYFRDVNDHLLKLCERLESLREQVWSTRDAFVAMSTYRANEAMKRLTVFSALFLPLTFVTGVFGMNFDSIIPWKNEVLAYFVLASVVILPGAMLFWFKRKKWMN